MANDHKVISISGMDEKLVEERGDIHYCNKLFALSRINYICLKR